MAGAPGDPNLRTAYEAAVRALQCEVDRMRQTGAGSEEVARSVHAQRRSLCSLFKAQTPEPLRSAIRQRTLSVYGDPLGPSIEAMRAMGRSWEEIIESATRPGKLDFEASISNRGRNGFE